VQSNSNRRVEEKIRYQSFNPLGSTLLPVSCARFEEAAEEQAKAAAQLNRKWQGRRAVNEPSTSEPGAQARAQHKLEPNQLNLLVASSQARLRLEIGSWIPDDHGPRTRRRRPSWKMEAGPRARTLRWRPKASALPRFLSLSKFKSI